MANIFYDRSGKAHVIGEKEKKEPNESQSPKNIKTKEKGTGAARKPDRRNDRDSKPSRLSQPSGRKDDRAPVRADSRKFGKPSGSVGKSPWGARGVEKSDDSTQSRGSFDGARASGGRGGRDGRGGRGSEARSGGGKFETRGSSRGGGRASEQKFKGRKKSFDPTDRGRGKQPRALPQRETNPDWIKLKAVVDKNKKGTAFLVFDRRDLEDVFIPRFYTDQLFHGDRVDVYLDEQSGEIEDLKVTEHRFKEIFGRVTLNTGRDDQFDLKKPKQKVRTGFLVYERKRAKEEVYLSLVPPEVKEGDWVKAEMVFGENGATTAKIVEHIGPTLPASFDIQMVAGEFNLTEHHTFDAVKQAESYTLEVPGKDEEGRTDLRHLPFMTIDGERARDFDDAVYVERTKGDGFKLWVAIADVSHYVKVGTPLDHEAYARATSVYFPERAFHMLPRALSEELCSLKPKVPRLALACSIEYNPAGEKGKIELFDAIIESRRRATYNEIEAEKEDPKHADLFALYKILKIARHDRGSIDFDFPEAEIVLDEKSGEPSDIVVRPRNDAHRLIEEFMIGANEAVTEWMLERKLPFIYRLHDEPSAEAIEKFRKLAKNMGVPLLSTAGIPRPKVLNEFIRTLKDHPSEPVLATGLLRSMRQAMYSATYGEHYGLASVAYTHFTSPIRRYPDLIVHRLLRETLHREQKGEAHPKGKALEAQQEKLDEMAEHCSYRERIATEAERESIRFKQVRLMAKNLGKEFEGKINGLTEKGMFVQLWHPYCEGMVSVESMKDDFYQFQEERMQMMGRRSNKVYTIGAKVKIQVVRVDLDTRRVEFELR